MKGETQAVLLEQMMQNKKVQTSYELILPLFMLSQSSISVLTKGDILLIGLDSLEMIIHANDNSYAKVEVIVNEKMQEIQIISMHERRASSTLNSKYKVLKCVLSTINIKSFEVGSTYAISNIDFEQVTLFVDNYKTAEGKLVEVEGKVAIEIKKVYDE